MKTFSQFVALKEGGILDVDPPDESDGGDECLLRAVSVALKSQQREDVISFLMRIAKQNTDVQIELDKWNHKKQSEDPRRRKKLRMGSANDMDRGGDVVVPNSADSAHGEMPS